MSDEEKTLDTNAPDTTVFCCPKCQHVAAPPADKNGAPCEPGECIIRCDSCNSIIAYGYAQPRVVIEPAENPRFIRIAFGETNAIVEKVYAAQIFRTGLSLLRGQ